MKQVRCLDGPARAAQIASRRILSVDDGSGIARRLGEAIGALTGRVRTAYSVPEGLQSGLLEPPDLLIVDLGSGGGGGSSLPGILRRLGTGKPFKVAGLTSLQGVQLSRLEGHLRPRKRGSTAERSGGSKGRRAVAEHWQGVPLWLEARDPYPHTGRRTACVHCRLHTPSMHGPVPG